MLPESLVWVSPGRESWQSGFGAAGMYCCGSNSCPLMGPAPCSPWGAQQRASPWPVKSGSHWDPLQGPLPPSEPRLSCCCGPGLAGPTTG
uniref:Uncharacterized protein n=1 Tax=Cyanoderma ruficeps TaxID=181631 RepID=A0A8C3QTR3_9PASS